MRRAATALVLAFALVCLTGAGDADARSFRASPERVAALRSLGPVGEVALVELMQVREAAAFARYRKASEERVRSLGGRRIYAGSLDRPSEGGDPRMRFDTLWIDLYPNAGRVIAALQAPIAELDAALADRVAFAMTPSSTGLYTGVRWVSKTLRLFAGEEIDRAPRVPLAALGEEDPDAAALETVLSGANERDSLMVFNLNRYRSQARYRKGDPEKEKAVDGATAYRRYGTTTVPLMIRRGAYPVWGGQPRVVVVGQGDAIFDGAWDEFVLVHYPSRIAMRDMLNDPAYAEGFFHRRAGIERALVLPGTPEPAYDPAR